MVELPRFSIVRRPPTGSSPTLPGPFRGQPQPFHAENRRLRGPVPSHFEAFYREHLRFVPGARLKSSDVGRFYGAWAAAITAPSLTAREIKRAMANIGHRTLSSNGVRYCDVALAADCEDVADNFPALPLPAEAQAVAIADRLVAITAELASIADFIAAGRAH